MDLEGRHLMVGHLHLDPRDAFEESVGVPCVVAQTQQRLQTNWQRRLSRAEEQLKHLSIL